MSFYASLYMHVRGLSRLLASSAVRCSSTCSLHILILSCSSCEVMKPSCVSTATMSSALSSSSSSSSSLPSSSGSVHVDSAPRLTHTTYGQWKPRMETFLMRLGFANVCKNEIEKWNELVAKVEEWERKADADLIQLALNPKESSSSSTSKNEADTMDKTMKKQVKELVVQSQKVYSILYESIPEDLRPLVADIPQGYGYGLWKWLGNKFQSTEADTVSDLIKGWMEMRMEGNESFDAYKARVNHQCALLTSAEEKPSPRVYAYILLDKLQPRFKQAVLALKASDRLKDVKKVNWEEITAFINTYERNEQRIEGETTLGHEDSPGKAMGIKDTKPPGERNIAHPRTLAEVECFGCHEFGHLRRNCPNRRANNTSFNTSRGRRGGGRRQTHGSPHPRNERSRSSSPGASDKEGPGAIQKQAKAVTTKNRYDALSEDEEDGKNSQQHNRVCGVNNVVTWASRVGKHAEEKPPVKHIPSKNPIQPKSALKAPATHLSKQGMSAEDRFGVDTMASINVSGNQQLFLSLERCPPAAIEVANKQLVVCYYKGSVRVPLPDCIGKDGKVATNRSKIIKDVYYHESFSTNLLSWVALKQLKWQLHSTHERTYLVTPENEEIDLSTEGKVLMIPRVKLQAFSTTQGKIVITSVDQLVTLHGKLCHVGFDRMMKIIKAQTTNDLGELKMDKAILEEARKKILDCPSCAKGKGKRSPFGHSGLDRGTQTIEVLHMDSFEQIGGGEKEYGLVVVDPHAELLWTASTYRKNELTRIAIDIIRRAETQSDMKVKRIYSDNGSEFINDHFLTYVKSKGITLKPSPPYTQQLDGIAERYVGTAKAGARTLLNQTSTTLPKKFWKYALIHFAYIWNRSHVAKATGVTPFESIRKKKPSLKYAGVFGCDAYCYVPKHQRYGNTYHPKMEPGIYVGHDDEQMAAMIYLLADGRVVHTRDVDMRENSFTHAQAVSAGSKTQIEQLCQGGYRPLEDEPNGGEDRSSTEEEKDDDESGKVEPEINEDGTEEWLVESILGKRKKGKKRPIEYRVKWKGFPESEATWEPEKHLAGVEKLIEEYNDGIAKRTRSSSKSKEEEESKENESESEVEPDVAASESTNESNALAELKEMVAAVALNHIADVHDRRHRYSC